jgi:hypothetical protein
VIISGLFRGSPQESADDHPASSKNPLTITRGFMHRK